MEYATHVHIYNMRLLKGSNEVEHNFVGFLNLFIRLTHI